jgi:hypothetical protein
MPKEEEVEAVLTALRDDRWDWRTVRGVASDTGLTEAVVRRILEENGDVIIQSEVPSVKGDALYTTVDHWDKKATVGQKLLGAFRNRRR